VIPDFSVQKSWRRVWGGFRKLAMCNQEKGKGWAAGRRGVIANLPVIGSTRGVGKGTGADRLKERKGGGDGNTSGNPKTFAYSGTRPPVARSGSDPGNPGGMLTRPDQRNKCSKKLPVWGSPYQGTRNTRKSARGVSATFLK